jgi:hypothetical protein
MCIFCEKLRTRRAAAVSDSELYVVHESQFVGIQALSAEPKLTNQSNNLEVYPVNYESTANRLKSCPVAGVGSELLVRTNRCS